MDIHGYDFDETIYDGDCTVDFYLYCLRNHPKILLHSGVAVRAIVRFLLKIDTWSQMKGKIFGYFKILDDIDTVVKEFWIENKHKIKSWYMNRDRSNDVIISASPEFLLEPICYDYLGVKMLIGTRADKKSGMLSDKNCYGNVKVKRLNEVISDYHMIDFYSDSLSDEPLARLADKSYIVIGNKIIPWDEYKVSMGKKIRKDKSRYRMSYKEL